MEKTVQHGIKEWSAIVDALGTGMQSIIVRTYQPRYEQVLLFPTFNFWSTKYTTEAHLRKVFQEQFIEFAQKSGENAAKLSRERNSVELKYFVLVEGSISINAAVHTELLKPYIMWQPEHLRRYAEENAKSMLSVWLLRTYRLLHPVRIQRPKQTMASFYQHPTTISTLGAKPIKPEAAHLRLKSEIISVLGADCLNEDDQSASKP